MRFINFTFWKLVKTDQGYVAMPYITFYPDMVEWHLSPSQLPEASDV